jgi:hypothetical protein
MLSEDSGGFKHSSRRLFRTPRAILPVPKVEADADALSLSHFSKATDAMHFDEKTILLLAGAQTEGPSFRDRNRCSPRTTSQFNPLDRELDAIFDMRA